MSKIRILPELLANRIAAGEVVERPASVVKELIENSIDAGASRIEVEIEGGGTRLIRVLDNGVGMDEDDVLLSFERHGTSKILDDNDLVAISTLGFRGEAIPSIASVSKMTITSRTESSPLGSKVEFDYGRLQKVQETGCSQGTMIEVRGLFGRTPARKKFLRTTRTELGHIDEIIKSYALGCPTVAFTLRVDGRETITLNSGHHLEERLRIILRYHETFIQVGSPTKTGAARQLHGYLVPPERSATGTSRLRLFINGRAIKDRLMHHAVIEGLRGFLLKGHSPAGYLHLRLPADEIDINVHPAKHEVRFRNGRDIHQFIKQTIEEAMHGYQQVLRADLRQPTPTPSNYPPPPAEDYAESSYQPFESKQPHSGPRKSPSSNDNSQLWQTTEVKADYNQLNQHVLRDLSEPKRHGLHSTAEEPSPFKMPPKPDNTTISLQHTMRVVGQYKNLYIFCQAGDNLMVIDQHAAHERLLYEKFRRQYAEGSVASQTLLFPETVELSPFQIQLVEDYKDELQKIGFSLAEFGGNSYVISAVPAISGGSSGRDLFFNVLNGFGSEGRKRTAGNKLDEILANMACKAAVKSGNQLSIEEIDGLLNKMAQADLFSHCPHGRPVIRTFSPDDIKKWFNRT